MRFHRHQVGRTRRWHSVRTRHEEVWDWCAHHEEIERHLSRAQRPGENLGAGKQLTLQSAH